MAVVALHAEPKVERWERPVPACESAREEEEMPPLWAILLLPVVLLIVGVVIGVRKFWERLTV
jgi:hypothetical protein